MNKKKQNKHVYSTYALLLFVFLLFAGYAIATVVPGGVDGSIQFNDNGTLNGSTKLVYDKDAETLTWATDSVDVRFQEISLYGGAYKLPIINGTDSASINSFAIYDNIFAFDSGTDAGGSQIYLYQQQFNDYALIGLKNDVLTVQGTQNYTQFTHPVQFNSYVKFGTNTFDGLSSGDINVSTVYYDTLTAKSPTFQCSQGSNWCKITVPEYQQELYIEHDGDWNVQKVVFSGTEYTASQFVNNICPLNTRTQETCDKIIEKYRKIKCERDGVSAFVNGTCYVNPVLQCNSESNTSWSFSTNNCEYDAQKECELQGNIWTGSTCVTFVAPPPTLEQQQEQCLKDKSTIWYNNNCISLESYYS